MLPSRSMLAALGTLSLVLGGPLLTPARAQAPSSAMASPAMVHQSVSGVAIVESVDHGTRQILLRGPQGKLFTITVGPQVRNLAQLRAGDRVNITYQRAVAVQLAAPGRSLPPATGEAGAARAALGEMPAGAVFTMVHVVVRVNSMDPANHTVTFTDPDGVVHTVVLRTEAMRNFAGQLKPGDNVQIEYLQALTVNTQPGPS